MDVVLDFLKAWVTRCQVRPRKEQDDTGKFVPIYIRIPVQKSNFYRFTRFPPRPLCQYHRCHHLHPHFCRGRGLQSNQKHPISRP